MNISDILILGPEILLIIYALMSILFASFFKHESSNHFIFNCTILMFLISALIIYFTPLEGESNIESIFIRDSFSKFFQSLYTGVRIIILDFIIINTKIIIIKFF